MENSKAVHGWKAQELAGAKYLGVLEFVDPRTESSDDQEFIIFEIVRTKTHFVFGNYCNIGLLESGNYQIDPDFSDDENLQDLMGELDTYYRDGPHYVTDRFSCNERM